MKQVCFEVSKEDATAIKEITDRVMSIYADSGIERGRLQVEMDLTACHANGHRLQLDKMLGTDDNNLMHDVNGIWRHLDRVTGQLTDHFLPRFAA